MFTWNKTKYYSIHIVGRMYADRSTQVLFILYCGVLYDLFDVYSCCVSRVIHYMTLPTLYGICWCNTKLWGELYYELSLHKTKYINNVFLLTTHWLFIFIITVAIKHMYHSFIINLYINCTSIWYNNIITILT